MELVMFSKHFGPLSVREAGERIRAIGFEGVDLTVRPGGHVLPEQVAAGLPAAVATLREVGLGVPMISTGITSASAPEARATFAAAAEAKIRWLKLGYWSYRPFGQLRQQLDAARRDLDGIERLAGETGVCACLHTHSGNYLTGTAAGMEALLRDRDHGRVGAYLDPGHLTVEGGLSGCQQAIDLLQAHVRLVAIKDFGWFREEGGEGKTARWQPKLVPLAEGVVRWPEVFANLRQVGFDGVASVHSEYQGSSSWRDLSLPELAEQTRRDLAYLRPVLRQAGYGNVAL
jgi:sugar phosphate isomerase/epimerase